jgi:poly(A) polymerase
LLEQPLPTDWRSEIDRGAKAVLPVSAADLMPLLQGVALGACLKEIEALWLASNLRLDRAALLG